MILPKNISVVSNTPTQGPIRTLQENLLLLRSADPEVRTQAFDQIRPLGKPEISAAYQQVRQLTPSPGWELDCLERMEVERPDPPIHCERCVCTVVSPGYEAMTEVMLDTLACYGRSPEARVVVFTVDDSYHTLSHRTDITRIRCRSLERLSAAVKGALYSASRFIKSEKILTLESDMLVVDSLQPLWALLDVVCPTVLLGSRPGQSQARFKMLPHMTNIMKAKRSDMEFITGLADFDSPFWFNGGVIAGAQAAFMRLDTEMRRLAPYSILWMEGGSPVAFTDEYLMNLCLSLMNNSAEFAGTFNQQFYDLERDRWVQTVTTSEGSTYRQDGYPSRILHMISTARELMWEIKSEIDESLQPAVPS